MRTNKRMIVKNISITKDLYEAMRIVAEKESMTVSELIRNLARDYIKKHERLEKKAIKQQMKQQMAVNQ
jgi:metal-responsive CopG/Arc/MetJ family transcriptional regulator